MAYQHLAGKVALVTGASAGIGRAIAVELARRTGKVALLARRRERLQELAAQIDGVGGESLVVAGDVTDDNSVAAAVAAVVDSWGRIDILVNNAGAGMVGPLETAPVADAMALFNLNVIGGLRTIREVVPIMRRQGESAGGGAGAIVQIASGAGVIGMPFNAVYSGTKFANVGMAQALRLELQKTGITVHCVYPVGTETEFLEAATHHMEGQESRRFFSSRTSGKQTAEHVAVCTVRGVARGTADIYPYPPVRAMRLLQGIAPRLTERLSGVVAYRDRLAGD